MSYLIDTAAEVPFLVWILVVLAVSIIAVGWCAVFADLRRDEHEAEEYLRKRERRIAYYRARGELYPDQYVDAQDERSAAVRARPLHGADGGHTTSPSGEPSTRRPFPEGRPPT